MRNIHCTWQMHTFLTGKVYNSLHVPRFPVSPRNSSSPEATSTFHFVCFLGCFVEGCKWSMGGFLCCLKKMHQPKNCCTWWTVGRCVFLSAFTFSVPGSMPWCFSLNPGFSFPGFPSWHFSTFIFKFCCLGLWINCSKIFLGCSWVLECIKM